MDAEALVQRATTELARQRRLDATLQLVRGFSARKATALVLRVFESHAHAPWKRDFAAEVEGLVRALEAEQTQQATKVLRALFGRLPKVARVIADALVRMHDTGAVATLVEVAAQSHDAEALAAAAYALGKLGGTDVVMALKALADRTSGDAEREAKLAVATIQARVGDVSRGALSPAGGGELSVSRRATEPEES